MKKQKGFTLIELIIVLAFLSFASTVLYVAVHFITKFW